MQTPEEKREYRRKWRAKNRQVRNEYQRERYHAMHISTTLDNHREYEDFALPIDKVPDTNFLYFAQLMP